MKDFYLTLLSDSSLHMYPDNKQNSFTVKLDHPIQTEKRTLGSCVGRNDHTFTNFKYI